jgi:hypothetical protein
LGNSNIKFSTVHAEHDIFGGLVLLSGLKNYAGWMSVRIRDLSILQETHNVIWHEFKSGKCTVQKTQRLSSASALDQGHEQMNIE